MLQQKNQSVKIISKVSLPNVPRKKNAVIKIIKVKQKIVRRFTKQSFSKHPKMVKTAIKIANKARFICKIPRGVLLYTVVPHKVTTPPRETQQKKQLAHSVIWAKRSEKKIEFYKSYTLSEVAFAQYAELKCFEFALGNKHPKNLMMIFDKMRGEIYNRTTVRGKMESINFGLTPTYINNKFTGRAYVEFGVSQDFKEETFNNLIKLQEKQQAENLIHENKDFFRGVSIPYTFLQTHQEKNTPIGTLLKNRNIPRHCVLTRDYKYVFLFTNPDASDRQKIAGFQIGLGWIKMNKTSTKISKQLVSEYNTLEMQITDVMLEWEANYRCPEQADCPVIELKLEQAHALQNEVLKSSADPFDAYQQTLYEIYGPKIGDVDTVRALTTNSQLLKGNLQKKYTLIKNPINELSSNAHYGSSETKSVDAQAALEFDQKQLDKLLGKNADNNILQKKNMSFNSTIMTLDKDLLD